MYREYYHQKLAPSSDIDLFIYALDEAAAIEKIKQIETHIRDSILAETTASQRSDDPCDPTNFYLDHSDQECNHYSFPISNSTYPNCLATV